MYNVHKVQILLPLELQKDKRSWKSGGNQTFYKICRLQPSYHISLINLEAIFNILMECFPGQPHQSHHPVAKQYLKLINYKCLASKWEIGIKSSPDGTWKIQKFKNSKTSSPTSCEESSPRGTALCLSLAFMRHKLQTLMCSTNGGNKKYHRMDILKTS